MNIQLDIQCTSCEISPFVSGRAVLSVIGVLLNSLLAKDNCGVRCVQEMTPCELEREIRADGLIKSRYY